MQSKTVQNDDVPVAGAIGPQAFDGERCRDQREEIAPAALVANRWITSLAAPQVAIPFLAAFGLVLLVVNLGAYPIYTKGEPREAIRILDITRGGGWILPTQAGIGLPWKPPLMYWLGAVISIVLGTVNEWTVRLPSGLLAVGSIVCCYVYVRRLFDERSALMAALILGTTLQFGQAATAARVDMTLTFFMEVAFFEFITIAEGLTRRRMLLYAALAAAILAKGPIGAALPGIAALVWIALERRWGVVRELRMIPGAMVILIVAGGWYVAATVVGGAAFVHRQILAENLYRLLPNHAFHEPHEHPFYYVELALSAGFLPWTGLVPVALAAIPERKRFWTSRFKYLLVWAAVVLIFYNLPRSKRGVYLLALYPAAATLTAVMLNAVRSRTSQSSRIVRLTALGEGVAFLAIGLVALVAEAGMWLHGPVFLASLMRPLGVRVPELSILLYEAMNAHWVAAIAIPAMVSASGAYLILAQLDIDKLFAAVLIGVSCSILVAHLFVVPSIARTLSLKSFTRESMKIADGHPVVSVWPINFDVEFYSGRGLSVGSFQTPHANYFICWRGYYRLLPASSRRRFTVVKVSGPTSLKGSRRMVLLERADLLPMSNPNPKIEIGRHESPQPSYRDAAGDRASNLPR